MRWCESTGAAGGGTPTSGRRVVEAFEASTSRARTTGRRWSATSARSTMSRRRCSGRLLLQDVHVAADRVGEGLRAVDPARGRPRHGADGGRSGRYVHSHAHADVLMVGGGPAGLAAALAARPSGKRVIVADEQDRFGRRAAARRDVDDRRAWRPGLGGADVCANCDSDRTCACWRARPSFGAFNHNHIALVERLTDHQRRPAAGTARERLWQVRAKHVVVADRCA